MPTKRRQIAPRRVALSDAAVTAWRDGDFHGLLRALGVGPHHPSPFDVHQPNPPAWSQGTCWAEGWSRAWELRQALLELAGEPGEMDRHGRPLGQTVVPLRR